MKGAIEKAGLKAEDVFPIFENSPGFNRKIVSVAEHKYINGIPYFSLEILHKEIKNKSTKVGIHTKWTSYEDVDLYYLVFGTPLIKKLVGKRKLCIVEPVQFCDTKYSERTRSDRNGMPAQGKCDFFEIENAKGKCLHELKPEEAIDYHRAQMANIKDIDKLKEYVRGLI